MSKITFEVHVSDEFCKRCNCQLSHALSKPSNLACMQFVLTDIVHVSSCLPTTFPMTAGVTAKVIYSGGADLDILPQHASKGKGLEFLLSEVSLSMIKRVSAQFQLVIS